MKVRDLSPLVTDWQEGKTRKAGKWSASDYRTAYWHRDVLHYGTTMVQYISRDGSSWDVAEVHTGHGSVSDQQGVNQLTAAWGLYYSRKGGAQVRWPS